MSSEIYIDTDYRYLLFLSADTKSKFSSLTIYRYCWWYGGALRRRRPSALKVKGDCIFYLMTFVRIVLRQKKKRTKDDSEVRTCIQTLRSIPIYVGKINCLILQNNNWHNWVFAPFATLSIVGRSLPCTERPG